MKWLRYAVYATVNKFRFYILNFSKLNVSGVKARDERFEFHVDTISLA